MKTKLVFSLVGLLLSVGLTAQTTLALWDFRGANDYVGTSETWYDSFDVAPAPDEYSGGNATAKFYTDGSATNRALRKAAASANGYCMALGWGPALIENSDLYWFIYGINTLGFSDLQLSFQVWSSNTGPREFKVQYRKPLEDNVWIDLHEGNLSFTSAKAPHSFVLPAACENKTHLDFRILRASSYQLTNPATVVSGSGQSRIDDVLLVGTADPVSGTYESVAAPVVYVSGSQLVVRGAEGSNATIYSLAGTIVQRVEKLSNEHSFHFSDRGTYLLDVNGKVYKIIL